LLTAAVFDFASTSLSSIVDSNRLFRNAGFLLSLFKYFLELLSLVLRFKLQSERLIDQLSLREVLSRPSPSPIRRLKWFQYKISSDGVVAANFENLNVVKGESLQVCNV